MPLKCHVNAIKNPTRKARRSFAARLSDYNEALADNMSMFTFPRRDLLDFIIRQMSHLMLFGTIDICLILQSANHLPCANDSHRHIVSQFP